MKGRADAQAQAIVAAAVDRQVKRAGIGLGEAVLTQMNPIDPTRQFQRRPAEIQAIAEGRMGRILVALGLAPRRRVHRAELQGAVRLDPVLRVGEGRVGEPLRAVPGRVDANADIGKIAVAADT